MLKRIAASIAAALIIPLFYLISYGSENNLYYSFHISDELGQNYSVLTDPDELMLIRSDGKGNVLGKCRIDRTDEYLYMSVDAMNVINGELYCVLSEINSKDFIIKSRKWLKINFGNGSAETVYQQDYGNIQNAYCTTLTFSENKLVTVSSLIEGLLITDVNSGAEELIDPRAGAVVNYAAALPDGRILYSDILNRIYILDKDKTARMIYASDAAGDFCEMYADKDGYCVICDTKTGEYFISADNVYENEIVFEPFDAAKTEGDVFELRVWFGRFFVTYCVMGGLFGLIVFFMLLPKRASVLFKIGVIISLFLGVGGINMFKRINSGLLENIHLDHSLENAYMTAKIIGAKIDTDKLEEIDWNAPEKSGYYSELEKLMEFDGTGDIITITRPNRYIRLDDKNYCWIYPVVGGEIRTGICDQNPVNLPAEMVVDKRYFRDYKPVAKGIISCAACGSSAEDFDWVIAVSPLKNSDGEIIALFETGISKINYTTTSTALAAEILSVIISFEILVVTLILLALGIALKPLKRLHGAVEAAGNGDYGITVKVRGRDEIAGIARAFNVMSRQIYDHTQNLSKLNASYLRFLPSGIISTIGKPSVLAVSRGDYSSVSGYILRIGLINFSELTESLSNDEDFDLINNISREIMENIISRNGVIESYNQEEYICIFNGTDPAYKAAVALIGRLRSLYPGLKTAFVIVKDSMLLGVVGHEKRLGTIMLSRGIGLSKKLGKIASVCGANLIVTDDVSFSAPCPQRLLGKIGFDGREYTFYDCFEGDEFPVYLSKLDGCAQFEEMILQYQKNDWRQCRRLALSYLENHKNDPAAIRYLFLCEDNIKRSKETAGIENMIS